MYSRLNKIMQIFLVTTIYFYNLNTEWKLSGIDLLAFLQEKV